MRALALAALAVWLAAGWPAGAAQTIDRVAYFVGPAGDRAEKVMAILAARMDDLGVHPMVSRDGDVIRVEIDAGSSTGYEIDLLTFPAVAKLHDGVEIVARCPTTPARACYGTANLPDLGGLLSVPAIPAIGGAIIERVRLDRDAVPATVTIRFTAKAARQFADLTAANVGNRLALVADRTVLAVPTVREPIQGGVAVISGDVGYMEVWAIMLSHPPLPYALEFLRDETAEPVVRNRRKRR